MRGLIIKDFYCLRRQLVSYGFILAGVIVISILFVLSYQYGNLAAGMQEMIVMGEVTQDEVAQVAKMAVLFFMLLPIACTGDLVGVFVEDEKASFVKVAAVMPVSIEKRVACRFVSGILFIAVGVSVDLGLSFVLASLTEAVTFPEFCGSIVSFASLTLIAVSGLILNQYFWGGKKQNWINTVSVVILVVAWISVLFLSFFAQGEDLDRILDKLPVLLDRGMNFIMYRSHILAIAAIVIALGAYLCAVAIAGRKRGVA